MSKLVRLDKFLADMNLGSRSQLKEAARRGQIMVNGQTEKKTERKVDPEHDQVVFAGKAVHYRSYEYYMLNKPPGVVSATADNRHQTVIDLLDNDKRRDLFPVGRLDIDTEGLLLITNDGDLAHRLLAPNKHVEKQYFVRMTGVLPSDAIEQMAAGMTISDDIQVKPARLEILSDSSDGAEALLTISEGKYHQVKRMFAALNCQVTYLQRLSMGSLRLDPHLQLGEYRELTATELQILEEETRL